MLFLLANESQEFLFCSNQPTPPPKKKKSGFLNSWLEIFDPICVALKKDLRYVDFGGKMFRKVV